MNFIGYGISNDIKPLSASASMNPSFGKISFWIVSHEQVFSPFLVSQCHFIFWPDDMCFATTREFTFISQSTIRALNMKHVASYSSMSYSCSSMFIDQVSSVKPVDRVGSRYFIWFAFGK